MGMKYHTRAEIECTPEECKLIDSLNRLAKKWEKDGKRLWLYSASGVLTVMMHGDREDNPIPEMLPNAGTNPDNIITTVLITATPIANSVLPSLGSRTRGKCIRKAG